MKKIFLICVSVAIVVAILGVVVAKRVHAPAPAPEVKTDERINIVSPKPGDVVQSPLTVSGEARGTWYFEASFPVKVLDKNGKVLSVVPAQAKSDWMTEDFVPFEATLQFNAVKGEPGEVVFVRDNPSGLPENDAEVRIPVIFGEQKEETTISAYFGNSLRGSAEDCSKVFAVSRTISKTEGVARAAIEELLKGPSETEKKDGFFTSINPGVKIQKLSVENGVATIDLDAAIEKEVGGSCRVGNIRAQIEQTLKQFATVKSVVISVNGRTEDILQP